MIFGKEYKIEPTWRKPFQWLIRFSYVVKFHIDDLSPYVNA